MSLRGHAPQRTQADKIRRSRKLSIGHLNDFRISDACAGFRCNHSKIARTINSSIYYLASALIGRGLGRMTPRTSTNLEEADSAVPIRSEISNQRAGKNIMASINRRRPSPAASQASTITIADAQAIPQPLRQFAQGKQSLA
jgi:hypothetical protein